MNYRIPRVVIAATASGAGKSTIAAGLLRVLAVSGAKVQGFKVGPDYIDPGYHTLACGRSSRNLDTFLLGEDRCRELFVRQAADRDLAIVEGVMGLFDGQRGNSDSGSTAEMARVLDAPVILVVDCRSMSRSVAALVKGFAEFDPDLKLRGIILNQVGSPAHETMLRDALAGSGIAIIGAIPRGALASLPSRHLGLVPVSENAESLKSLDQTASAITKYLDLALLEQIARSAAPLTVGGDELFTVQTQNLFPGVKIGLAWDKAFSFYYRDALDYLEHLGAELIFFSPLEEDALPPGISGIFLGGGFPEIYAAELAQNLPMRRALNEFAFKGGVIYAECGGLMYLTREISDFKGRIWPQVGLIPARSVIQQKLKALGYYTGKTLVPSILGPRGTFLKGHEFHYSTLESFMNFAAAASLFKPGGTGQKEEGFSDRNIYASYLHQHWAGRPDLAQNFLRAASSANGPKLPAT